jgi:NDP-sugar pyrophosphorylase family protein
MNIVIPMAGLGTRFKDVGIDDPKPLIMVNGRHLVEHSIESLNIDANYIFITRKYDNPEYNLRLTKILKDLVPNCTEIQVDKPQIGAAGSVLYAEHLIDNDEDLIVTNCDQLLKWNSNDFMLMVYQQPDGIVATFESDDPKNSFAKTTDGRVTEIKEKEAISNEALIGLHYWKHGKDFVRSAKRLVDEYKMHGMREAYLAPTYNYLISEGKNIVTYKMPSNSYISLGTPEDINIYNGKLKEFYSNKPHTIFCDIDGTIIKHSHRFSHVGKDASKDLSGVIDKFNEWDSKGHKIILTTARKESARYITEKQLTELGFCWDMLIMGVTSGKRVIINDKLQETDSDRALSVNVITDSGFDNVDWEEYGL